MAFLNFLLPLDLSCPLTCPNSNAPNQSQYLTDQLSKSYRYTELFQLERTFQSQLVQPLAPSRLDLLRLLKALSSLG